MSYSVWPKDNPPGSSVQGISQARIRGWVAIPFSSDSFWSRDQTWVSCITGRLFTIWATGEDSLFFSGLTQESSKRVSRWQKILVLMTSFWSKRGAIYWGPAPRDHVPKMHRSLRKRGVKSSYLLWRSSIFYFVFYYSLFFLFQSDSETAFFFF